MNRNNGNKAQLSECTGKDITRTLSLWLGEVLMVLKRVAQFFLLQNMSL